MFLSESWTQLWTDSLVELFVRSLLPRGSPPELSCVFKALANYTEVTDTLMTVSQSYHL